MRVGTVNQLRANTMMILFRKTNDLSRYLESVRKTGQTIGFVPTMGALHEGHLSLIRRSKEEAGLTVCSIFVNPTQFNDPTDFEKYPITLGADIQLLEKEGCEVLFLPTREEIYPLGTKDLPTYDLGFLETVWEGPHRPGHFQGVCQVVDILLTAVNPDLLFLGQKDYQQCQVIERLRVLTGRTDLKIRIIPTLREAHGLAMSSRNRRLSPADFEKAGAIYAAFQYLQDELKPGDTHPLLDNIKTRLTVQGFRVEYFGLARADTMEPVDQWDGKEGLVALAAVFLSGVRLIDNRVLTAK